MPYATIPDVQRLFHIHTGYVISDESIPSDADVEAWILEYGAQLNSLLKSAGYTVPITGENDVLYMRKIITEAVACRTWGIAFPVDDDQFPVQVRGWCDAWAEIVKAIKAGELPLIDQSLPSGLSLSYSSMLFDED